MNKSKIGYAIYEELFKPPQAVSSVSAPEKDLSVYEVPNEKKDVEHKEVSPGSELEMVWKVSQYANNSDPEVWGPSFWFIIHNGARNYPESPSPIAQDKMKGFIMGIPYIIPCKNCSEHANAYLAKNYEGLSRAVKSRAALFCFFVDFHNYVNERYGKKAFTCEEAWKLYSGGSKVWRMSYK